jgi:hypothetical protein
VDCPTPAYKFRRAVAVAIADAPIRLAQDEAECDAWAGYAQFTNGLHAVTSAATITKRFNRMVEPPGVGQTLRARFVDTSQPSAECNFLDSHAAEYGRSARSDDRPAQWRVDDGRATRERWGRQEESRVCLKMRALFRPFSGDVATSRKDHRLQQTGQPRIRARARQSQQEGQIHFPRDR